MSGGPPLTGERGSATVWVVALAGALAAIGVAAVLVGSAVVGRHRATGAADLAALAAAEHAVRGRADPCAAAARVADANGARLTGCGVDGAAVVEVAVVVPVRLGPLGVREAAARARAGPVAQVPVAPP
ncbi:Rv3654c family TadE-like protein [Geodermatophilus sabuli]|nr:Rv3654c family TadE-like protein [Geodermatophilus sabuli]MBB3083445.1 secretion/DNA translocation related TadE-like protein [Geodermatophilus sabuli]